METGNKNTAQCGAAPGRPERRDEPTPQRSNYTEFFRRRSQDSRLIRDRLRLQRLDERKL